MQEHSTISQSAKKFVAHGPKRIRPAAYAAKRIPAPKDIVDLKRIYADSGFYTSRSDTYQAFYILAKRGIDIVGSLAVIILTLPLFIMVALAVKATSRGPILFRHRRIGQYGNDFYCYKFRTMIENAEEVLKSDPNLLKQFNKKFKIDNDPRVTPIGDFLRKTSLDELPQLFQVLAGSMSLIGPRPIIERELEKYSIYQNKLLSVKPGLSGLWQTSGRSQTSYSKRVLLDMKYIDKRSITMDIKLILKTVVTVVKKSGAC